MVCDEGCSAIESEFGSMRSSAWPNLELAPAALYLKLAKPRPLLAPTTEFLFIWKLVRPKSSSSSKLKSSSEPGSGAESSSESSLEIAGRPKILLV